MRSSLLLIVVRLVVGSAMGSIDTLFDKMSAIHKKHGPFNLALCTGDFFGSSGVDDRGNAEKLLGGQLQGAPPLWYREDYEPIFSSSTTLLHHAG